MAKSTIENNDVIKKPYLKSSYTDKQFEELLECVEDPMYFMRNFMKIQHPLKGALPFIPYPFQERIITSFAQNRFTIALTARQCGKALSLDTPLPTPTGWTTMGDVKVGDYILGDDGEPVKVSFATDIMYGRKCYEIEFDNGEKIKADAEHLWKFCSSIFKRKKYEEKILTTKDAIPYFEKAKTQGQGFSINIVSPIKGDEIALPIKPYTLGVWLGDGESAAGRIYGHKDDIIEIIENIKNDGYDVGKLYFDPRNNVAQTTIIGFASLARTNNLRKNKHIPKIYLRASINQRLELLKGLMDSDGNSNRNGGSEFYQKNKILIDQVRELLSSLGIKSRIRTKIIKGQNYYTLKFATITPIFKLTRKLHIQKNNTLGHSRNSRFFVKSIKEISSVPVKCIQVDNESHMFLCGKSMIPTHNTTCAAGFLLWKAMFTPDTTILVTANKFVQALEIMDRIRFAYENMPDYIRAGCTEYNKGTVAFDNGSKIVSRATSTDAGRGLSVTLLYCLGGKTTVTIRDKITGEIKDVALEELYELCDEN